AGESRAAPYKSAAQATPSVPALAVDNGLFGAYPRRVGFWWNSGQFKAGPGAATALCPAGPRPALTSADVAVAPAARVESTPAGVDAALTGVDAAAATVEAALTGVDAAAEAAGTTQMPQASKAAEKECARCGRWHALRYRGCIMPRTTPSFGRLGLPRADNGNAGNGARWHRFWRG